MLTSDTVNISAAGTDILPGMNTSNVSSALLRGKKQDLDFQLATNHSREWTLLLMTLLSAIGHVIALLMHSRHLNRRRESWFCTAHVMFVGILIGYVPMLSQMSFEAGGFICLPTIFNCEMVKSLRIYFVTLSTYLLVALALNCYSIVVKPLTVTPTPFWKLYTVMVSFYALCSIPSICIYFSSWLVGADVLPRCIPYYYYLYRLSQYPAHINMGILLIFTYVIPIILILAILSKVFCNLWDKTSFFYTNKQASLQISRYDARFIQMAFFMCLVFIFTNLPFIVVTLANVFISFDFVDTNTSLFMELLSISNSGLNPFVFIIYEFRRGSIGCLTCEPNVKPDADINQNAMCRCCYKPVACDFNNGLIHLLTTGPTLKLVKSSS